MSTNLTSEQEKFLAYKIQIRAETLGKVEDALSRGDITQEEFHRYKEREMQRYVATVGRYARHYNISLPITPPQSPLDLSQEEVLLVASTNPQLHPWVAKWEQKEISWEQATYGIIYSLMHEANTWRDRWKETIEKHPIGFWLQPNDYTVIIKKDEFEKSMGVKLDEPATERDRT